MLMVREGTKGGVMKNSFGYARIALLCASAMLMSNLHAAPRCTTDVRVLVLSQSRLEQSATVVARTCREDCQPRPVGAAEPAARTPAHLSVLAEPVDVADRHAQIYERLSESRAAPDMPRYCEADINLL